MFIGGQAVEQVEDRVERLQVVQRQAEEARAGSCYV